jgi:Fe-S-cluster-containing dehydrogenase component/DMSO reductase anchor subunit
VAERYRGLLPAAPPGPGEQYAFDVDLDACTGCKSCVVACHSLNGLDEDESWRSVGLLQGGKKVAFQQTVTTACHHCVDPACLTGCPVDAYEKDDVTGIVSHLDDQCIGCSYCTLTCPYEVPRFNEARGIVRKCDMCRGRLEVGEAPACVQSCPNGAIKISVVNRAEVQAAAALPGTTLVPGAPSSALTSPTTVYRTSRPVPDDARAADHFSLRAAHPHPPLAAMLVLTQLAVGMVAIDLARRVVDPGAGRPSAGPAVVAALVAVVALVASTLHLGRPRFAFRAVLGWRHSWLSREVVAFGAFTPLAVLHAVAAVGDRAAPLVTATAAAATGVGIVGVACSVLLYAVTGRAWWRTRRSTTTVALSGLVTGSRVTAAVVAMTGGGGWRGLALVAAVASAVKLAWEGSALLAVRGGDPSDLDRSALLLRRDLRDALSLRVLLGVVGGIGTPMALALVTSTPTPAASIGVVVAVVIACGFVVAAELVERHLFFRVAVAPRMPGELR